MELFDDGWDDADEAYPFGIVPREVRRRFWSEKTWSPQPDEQGACGAVLFADRRAENELRAEIRLSQLWNRCRAGIVTSKEFGELSYLITVVDGIRGLLCKDCATLDRPNVSANWALGDTMLCRGHLRFRLGHARVDEDGAS
jgi:hypothetical protein